MDTTTSSSQLAYRLKESVEILEKDKSIVFTSPSFQVTISHLDTGQHAVMKMLAQKSCSAQWIHDTIIQAQGESQLVSFYRYLSCLIQHQMIYIYAASEDTETPLATLIPISAHFRYRWIIIQPDQPYRMSRFAYIRRDEDGFHYLESPLSHARIRLDSSIAASILYQSGRAITPHEMARTLAKEVTEDAITTLLTLFVMGNFVAPTTDEGQLDEDNDEACMQWDFHDLLFHSRSRVGRHNNPIGGTYRFYQRIQPQPVLKQAQWPVTIPLIRPDMDKIRQEDPGLTAVMEARSSIRTYGSDPMTATQLGEFLYRVARVKGVYTSEETGEFITRLYPSSGASYETEFYLVINRCEGLKPGFYWYDPLNHALSFIQEANKDTEKLLSDARQSSGSDDHPQILIILAARFQRVSWKYQSLAYALILKNVGVIYATMYLVATAMNLAPCALGVGDSDRFTKLSGSHYLQETSVGEFMLGSK
jgi:SagB-type dehydrogenase family enzyme